MKLLQGDIVLIHRGTGWQIFAPLVWLWQWTVGPYHVEMVWEQVAWYGYKAFSLQPPILSVVDRKFDELKITAYRLKNRSDLMTDIFWRWGNKWLDHPEFYLLGIQTCGHPVKAFYEVLGIEIDSPYPGGIEKFCRKSDKFVRVI